MKSFAQSIVDQIIQKSALIKNYPKEDVVFLSLDALFNDQSCREKIVEAVKQATENEHFDGVAGIASRGFLFTGMLANHKSIGEHFIQKVKVKGDSRFVQRDTKTEYSSDSLQVQKNSIKKGETYLLMDDLIATGGSAMTAIELIRKEGGIVHSVFVLTELVDLNARAALKKQGVALISVLKFTNEDLRKILELQAEYAQNNSLPVNYQLSHVSRHSSTHVPLLQEYPHSVHVASESPIKLAATQQAVSAIYNIKPFFTSSAHCPSGVSEQPFGETETTLGAKNRLDALQKNMNNPDNTLLVSMENGLRYDEQDKCYYDFVHVIVRQGKESFELSTDCCIVPDNIINHIRRDHNHHFVETWGQAAKRLGLVTDQRNPHEIFGEHSRQEYLRQALSVALTNLKSKAIAELQNTDMEKEFELKRLVTINSNKSNRKFEKRGVYFGRSMNAIQSKPINIYNKGCPVKQWQIEPHKVKRSDLKVFMTGDTFSIISPDIAISGADMNIHIGLSHDKYSPGVLLQEGLQLCRTASEQGARSITIALPEQYHPALCPSDLNILLLKLFKVSGADRVYFYDKSYRGNLDENKIHASMTVRLSDHPNVLQQQINVQKLLQYLSLPVDSLEMPTNFNDNHQVKQHMRRSYFKSMWEKFDVKKNNILYLLNDYEKIPELHVADDAQSAIHPKANRKKHVIISGSANKSLAREVSDSLIKQGEIVNLFHVEGNGVNARIPSEADLTHAKVTIVQSTRPNPDNLSIATGYQTNGAADYLFETAAIAREAHLRGAQTINLINPYQFSARSDRAEDNLKGKTGAYVQHNGRLLSAAGVNKIITAECHDTHTLSGAYTGKNISGVAVPALAQMTKQLAREWIESNQSTNSGQFRLVEPDAGAIKRTKELAAQLHTILGDKLCQTRILGEKQRNAHQDNSAQINSLNTGAVGINAIDKYVITDDETATGNTLCQAISSLKESGAKDIAVLVVHNNMPLDWLERQLCLARFIFMGVNDLRFSNTHEMGTLATDYDHLIKFYQEKTGLTLKAIEAKISNWFDNNMTGYLSDISNKGLKQSFDQFKASFSQFNRTIKIHSLADEFAQKVLPNPYMGEQGTLQASEKEIVNDALQTAKHVLISRNGPAAALGNQTAVTKPNVQSQPSKCEARLRLGPSTSAA